MKKFFSIMLMATTAFFFTSCGDDEEVPSPNQQQSNAPYAALSASFSFELTEAMADICDVTVNYTGEDGTLVKENVVNGKWSKSVRINKAVELCEMEVYVTKKADADLSENNATFGVNDKGEKFAKMGVNGGSVSVKTYDKNGNLISSKMSDFSYSLSLGLDKLEEYLNKYKDTPVRSCKVKINDKGGIE